jgi:hypothetical protein
MIKDLQSTPINMDEVTGLMPLNKIQPKKTKVKRITQIHGSLLASDLLERVKDMNEKEKEKDDKKKAAEKRKPDLKEAFNRCRDICECNEKCIVAGMRQCSRCSDVLKTQCAKAGCIVDGEKPQMLMSALSSGPSRCKQNKIASRKLMYAKGSSEDSDSDNSSGSDDDDDEEEQL